MKGFACDPVFEKYNRWYFWDETWSRSLGPWDTRGIARKELKRYCDGLNYVDDVDHVPAWGWMPLWLVALTAGLLGTALFILLLSGLVMAFKNAFWI